MKKTNKRILGILLFSKQNKNNSVGPNIQRIIDEATKQNLTPKIFYYNLFSVSMSQKNINIYYEDKKINPKDIFFMIAFYDISLGKESSKKNWFIAECLEELGVKIFNSPKSAKIVQNKRDVYLRLSKQDLPIIQTFINFSEFNLGRIINKHKSETLIAKSANGLQGYGTVILNSHISFISFMEFLIDKYPPSNLLIQPFMHFNQTDYRIFVVGNQVVAGISRKSNGIEFRSNLNKGGVGTKINVTKNMAEIATKTTKTLNLDFAGVDIGRETKTGKYYIIEVNGLNPGLKIEEIAKVNISVAIINHCIKKSK
ncbi:MAG: hypothetical protein ABIA91_00380 [Patescibacteria group bacterium]